MRKLIDFHKSPEENDLQFCWRVCRAKDVGEVNASWREIAALLNRELRSGRCYSAAAYRKPYQSGKAYYEHVFSRMSPTNGSFARQEEMIQLRDERAALRDEVRRQARVSHKMDCLEDEIRRRSGKPLSRAAPPERSDAPEHSMLALVSDLHMGACFNNAFGRYDAQIARIRMSKYADAIKRIAKRNGTTSCDVALLGDMISGNIHKSISVTNRENVIKQIMDAAETIEAFLIDLYGVFDSVRVCSVSGNHSRIDRREDALKDERLDDLVLWYIKNALTHFKNLSFEPVKDTSLADMDIHGRKYVFVHGDYDATNEKGVLKISSMFDARPYCICCGHKHVTATNQICGVRIVQAGSVCGAGDDYTVTRRLVGNPEQSVLLLDNNGIIAHYPIDLSERG